MKKAQCFCRIDILLLVVLVIQISTVVLGDVDTAAKQTPWNSVRLAAAEGRLAYKLTTPEELNELLGPAIKKKKEREGGWEVLFLEYSGVKAVFGRMRDDVPFNLFSRALEYSGFNALFGRMRDRDVPFTLLTLTVEGKAVDIGEGKQIVLRNEGDLLKFDSFWGFENASLVNLDLRKYAELLEKMPFDSLTQWPDPNKLPDGFNPAVLLEEGKNPGLGIRQLHAQGIDGRGVGIAIIDQPLLKDHQEYCKQLRYSTAYGLARNCPPQMHSEAVASIAVGKDCGVAPGAGLYFYQTFFNKEDNQFFCGIIQDIIKLNRTLSGEKIRVISISTGMFPCYKNYDQWKKTLEMLDREKIFLVSCDTNELNYGTLARVTSADSDDPNNFIKGRYGKGDVLLVPAGNRTIACEKGTDAYTFDRIGGMSWGAPYLAGLAAMAYQVNPDITPKAIKELLVQTATKTQAGPVVNPGGFIQKVSELKAAN